MERYLKPYITFLDLSVSLFTKMLFLKLKEIGVICKMIQVGDHIINVLQTTLFIAGITIEFVTAA